MRLARTFDDDPGQVVHPSAPLRNYMEVLGAAGSWVATPSDIVTIMNSIDPALPGWHPLSPAMLELMRQPQTLAYPTAGRWYGLGLMSFGDGSFGHTGTVESTHAMVVDRPDGVVWAVLVSGEYPWETNDLRVDLRPLPRRRRHRARVTASVEYVVLGARPAPHVLGCGSTYSTVS